MTLITHSLKCHHNEPSIIHSIHLNRFLLTGRHWRNVLCDSRWKGCDWQDFSIIFRYCLGAMDAVGLPQMPLSEQKDMFSQVPVVQLLWELPKIQEAASTKVMPHHWDSPLPVADSLVGINTCTTASNQDVSRVISASVQCQLRPWRDCSDPNIFLCPKFIPSFLFQCIHFNKQKLWESSEMT